MPTNRFDSLSLRVLPVVVACLSLVGGRVAYAISEADRQFVERTLHTFASAKEDKEITARTAAILETDPGATRARFLLGLLLQKQGYESLAMDQYRLCIEQSPQNYDYHYQLLLVAIKVKDDETIVAEMNQCEKLANGDGFILMKLGLTMENAGYSKYCDRIYEKASQSKVRAYGVGYSLAKVRYDQGRYDEAIKCLNWDLVKEPNSVRANTLKGEILIRLNLPKEATNCFMRAFQKSPCEADAAALVARELYKMGRLEEALGPALTDMLCHSNNQEKNAQTKKFALSILKKVPLSVVEPTIEAVAQSAPSMNHRQFFYLAVGDLLDQMNQRPMAMATYEKALAIKTNPPSDLMLARGYYRLGLDQEIWSRSPEKALELYRLSNKIYPDDKEVEIARRRLEDRMDRRAEDSAGRIKDALLKGLNKNNN